MKLEYHKDQAAGWRWRLRSANGEIIAASSESFTRRWSAKRNFWLFIKSATTITR